MEVKKHKKKKARLLIRLCCEYLSRGRCVRKSSDKSYENYARKVVLFFQEKSKAFYLNSSLKIRPRSTQIPSCGKGRIQCDNWDFLPCWQSITRSNDLKL